jgi:hypothetical protein
LLRDSAEGLIRGDALKDSDVKDAMLQRDPGSALTDWYKVSSEVYTTSEGHSFELHFYLNTVDNSMVLDLDYHVVFKVLF